MAQILPPLIPPSVVTELTLKSILVASIIVVVLLPIALLPLLLRKLFPKRRLQREGQRMGIPREVQEEVYERDEGKCVYCESKRNLEFDHIIPLAKGGSDTVRNLQILCQKCNRQKSSNF